MGEAIDARGATGGATESFYHVPVESERRGHAKESEWTRTQQKPHRIERGEREVVKQAEGEARREWQKLIKKGKREREKENLRMIGGRRRETKVEGEEGTGL